ncbi:MetQ/NlpA family ABC transporter substrate-binding protein [Nostoc sphaeroides]|uniref:NLPA lipoprotein n=1 Tax=Nostoc sphaeroides CCNUC1 TaxID=2653204 RepID=A0A5P8WBA3_9NOSO|nr:MetQ/NlpA family ABC transporter substrate-binding protein [Nostoc sphaeroides]MCC5632056.1 hypothetical protein [Nostoc sphaeroides CHAB 2801]QFS49960.1 NLPA lipoprotein [Nostoc sphaeroides CCNUC1]
MFYPKFYRRYFILTTGLAIASIFFASCTPKPNSYVRALDDLDLAVTSASFLVQAKVSLNPIVLDEIGMANKNYAVGLATLESKVNDPNIQKLNQLVVDPKLKDYINNYFKGTIAPVF